MSVLVLCLGLLSGCNNEGFEYNDYHCNLTIDNSKHLNITLASAMDAMTPGVFCTIRYAITDGVTYFVFSNNYGDQSKSMFNAIDENLQSHRRIGMNNGLIVGFGNLDSPPLFYAYDLQCPNCFDLEAIPVRSYPLDVKGSGVASCAKCKRSYNLNTGGNIVSGDKGSPLKPYRAATSGPNGVLRVY